MRRRAVHADIWQDEKFAKLSFPARLLFIGIITLSNDYGKLRGNPTYLKSNIFPYDDSVNLENSLKELTDKKIIISYSNNGEQFLKIKNWFKHQTLTYKGHDGIPEP
jgi:hypothetical protein